MNASPNKTEFCAAPFTQLMLRPDGAITPCCHLYNFVLGKIQQQSITEIWNNPRMQKLRAGILDGDAKPCRSRQKHLQCQREFERFNDVAECRDIQQIPPRRLDIRLNSKCNLRCVMCDVWEGPNGIYDKDRFWQQGAKDIFPYLNECDILGGEPFIQPDTFKLIEAITAVNPTCAFSFVTNAHYPLTQKIKNLLSRINIRMLQVSLDSLNPVTYQKIRIGGEHALVMETLIGLMTLRDEVATDQKRSFQFKLSMCVLKYNWEEIPEFLAFCGEHGLEPELQYAHYDPSGAASLSFLSAQERGKVTQLLQTALSQYPEHAAQIRKALQPLII